MFYTILKVFDDCHFLGIPVETKISYKGMYSTVTLFHSFDLMIKEKRPILQHI